jgi:hypothetical protein
MPVVETLRKLMARRSSKLAVLGAAILLVGCAPLLVGLASAASNPGGNNGTVKIHEEELDSNPHNQPHVGCPFTVAFFGFDTGDVAQVEFTAWAPTGKGTSLLTDTVDIGADDNSGGGSSAGFDGEKSYTLNFGSIVPQEQQGFHVKLQVSVDSPGSNTPKFNKYKVFWATGCEAPTTTTTVGQTTTTVGETTTTVGETTTTTGAPTTTVGETTTTAGETTTTAEQTTTTAEQQTTTTAEQTTTTAP